VLASAAFVACPQSDPSILTSTVQGFDVAMSFMSILYHTPVVTDIPVAPKEDIFAAYSLESDCLNLTP